MLIYKDMANYSALPNPIVETNTFRGESSSFAVIRVDTTGSLGDNDCPELKGAVSLRTNVYEEMGFLKNVQLNPDGKERDEDDLRSVHFITLERLATCGFAKVIGNMRLVKKNNLYPEPFFIERHFPEYFEENVIPENSVEVGRLISRHETPRTQAMIKWALFLSALTYVNGNNYNKAFGLMTPKLTQAFVKQGVPITGLAEPKYILDINATKQPVEIDLPSLGELSSRMLGTNPPADRPVLYVDNIINNEA